MQTGKGAAGDHYCTITQQRQVTSKWTLPTAGRFGPLGGQKAQRCAEVKREREVEREQNKVRNRVEECNDGLNDT